MKKWFGAFLLSAALTAPITMPTVVRADDDHQEHRYYDSERHDYHEWNAGEQRAYRHYWQEQHRDYVEWNRLNDEQRRAYWRWRHEHMRDFPERTDMPRDTR